MMLTPHIDHDDDGLAALMRVWDSCMLATPVHPYLACHELPVGELRVWKEVLIGKLVDHCGHLTGLLIVDDTGAMASWSPSGRFGHHVIGTPCEVVIIAAMDLADAMALHEICGHQVLLAATRQEAQLLRDHMLACELDRRILAAGWSMAEASEQIPQGMVSADFLFPPPGMTWSMLRRRDGHSAALRWVEDPILAFGEVLPGPTALVRSSGTWLRGEHGIYSRIGGAIMPIAMLRNGDGNEWSRLTWFVDRDGIEKRVSLSERDVLMAPQKALALLIDAGLEVTSAQTLDLFTAMQRGTHVWGRLRLVDRGGWHGSHYVGNVGTIGPRSADMPVQMPHLDLAPSSDATAVAKWKRDIGALALGNSRLVLAICAAFAGLVIGLIHGMGSFGIHFGGMSSLGKSTALAVAASILGSSTREICTWRATENGVETLAARHHHRLLILDELAQIDARAAAQIAYTIGNGVGKARANGAGRAVSSASWQLVFLSTGEIGLEEKIAEWHGAPAMREGQAVRLMDLPADAGRGFGLFDELHGHASGAELSDWLKSACAVSTGDVAKAFLEQLTVDVAAAKTSLVASRDRFLSQQMPGHTDGLTRRAIGHFAFLGAAGELAIAAGVLPWCEGHAQEQMARCARDWIAARSVSPVPDPLDHVKAWLQQHLDSLQPWEQADESENEALGYLRMAPRTYFLRPKGWQALCAGHDESRVRDALLAAGLMRNTAVRRPGGGLVRCRIIDGAKLNGVDAL